MPIWPDYDSTMSIIKRFTGWAPRILGTTRILAGIFFVCHGAQLLGAFGGVPKGTPAALIWTAGPLEIAGGALIAIGLFSRITAFLLSGMMAVAYFTGHAPKGFWPTLNGGELAIVYCWFYLYLAAHGPGGWALDNLRRNAALEHGEGAGDRLGSGS
jgi:putative oxidoreductase